MVLQQTEREMLEEELSIWLEEHLADYERIQYDRAANRFYVTEVVDGELTEEGLDSYLERLYLPAKFNGVI